MSQKGNAINNVDAIIKLVLAAAKKAREDAGYGGRHDDGGEGRMKDQVKFYNYGREGIIPPEWKEHEIKLDPEYAEYQRLQQKFGQR